MKHFHRNKPHVRKTLKKLHGFSFGELMIVVMIVTLLALTIIMGYQTQVAKANDSKRKEDLNKYKIAFEDFYNDNNCYPTEDEWNGYRCDTADFVPYMNNFLCDPTTRQHYYYESFTDANGLDIPCTGYKLYAKLENKGDPDIGNVGCGWTMGCGVGTLANYNYGISVGGPLTAADFNPNPTSTPTDSPVGMPGFGPPPPDPGCASADGPWACNTAGVCNNFSAGDFSNGRCSVGFATNDCCLASNCSPASIWCIW